MTKWKRVLSQRLVGCRKQWSEYHSQLENGTVAWVLTSNGDGVWKHQAKKWGPQWFLLSTMGQLSPELITHWMPLPNPPKPKAPARE